MYKVICISSSIVILNRYKRKFHAIFGEFSHLLRGIIITVTNYCSKRKLLEKKLINNKNKNNDIPLLFVHAPTRQHKSIAV